MREGVEKAGVVILEPIMDVEVRTPPDCIGAVVGRLNSMRGAVKHQTAESAECVLRADVPLANLFGYWSVLRSQTQGRGAYTALFSHYAPLPPNFTTPSGTFPPAVGMRA